MLSTEPARKDLKVNPARPKVLIVENEGIVALNMCTMSEALGYDVIGITDSGNRAIEMAKANPPDIVLMDIRINSGLNGVETAICLQGLFDQPIPIVFVTGYSVDDFPVIKAVHPYVILKKPFFERDLSASLLRVWADSKAS